MLPKQRYTAVAWLEQSDLQPAGRAMWEIDCGDEIALGYFVNHTQQLLAHTLMVRAVKGNGNDGGHITISLRERLTFDDDGA